MINRDMNLYQKFYAIAKKGSFIKAAEDLYCTQPALSKSMKILEEQLGTKLMYRKNNGIELTDDGKCLYKSVEESLKVIEVGEKRLKENNENMNGELSIGIQSHLANFFLFPYIIKFKEKYPNIKINIRSRKSADLLEQLEDNKVDIVIDTSPIESVYNNLTIIELMNLKSCFVSYQPEKIRNIEELENKKIILPVRKSTMRKRLNEYLESKNVYLNPIMTIETTELLKNAVLAKMGIGYVLEVAVENDIKEGKLFKLKLNDKFPEERLNVIYVEKYLTRIPKKFLEEIELDLKVNVL